MTFQQLEQAFQTYLEQIPRLRNADAYWALLHYIIIFPDICGALESANGKASGNSYTDWARRYVQDNNLLADEWYDIRCLLLHQGITTGRRRYALYSFGQPGTINHKEVDPQKNIIGLDVSKMADEILAGMTKWFKYIADNTDPSKSNNVAVNLGLLSTVQVRPEISSNAVTGTCISYTTSSPRFR